MSVRLVFMLVTMLLLVLMRMVMLLRVVPMRLGVRMPFAASRMRMRVRV